MVLSKGQLISKCLFGVFNFPIPKKNKNKLTWGIIVVKSNFLFVFWEYWEYQKVLMKLTIMAGFSKLCTKSSSIILWKCPNKQINEQKVLNNFFLHLFCFFNSNFYATECYLLSSQNGLKNATHCIEVNMAKVL